MPTEGLKTRKAVVDVSATRRKPKLASHRRAEFAGIGLVAVGLVVLVTLLLGRGGLVGDSVTGAFRTFFGQGTWAVPFVLCFAGGCLVMGRAAFQGQRVFWGTLLVFLGLLAFFAREVNGDFFDPEALSTGGGYLGGSASWAMHTLLGPAHWVGNTVFLVIGALLCIEDPVREIINRFAQTARKPIDKIRNRPTAATKEKKALPEADDAKEARRRATVRMLEGGNEVEEEPAKPLRRHGLRQDPEPSKQVELAVDPPAPKDGYQLPPLSLLVEPSSKSKRDPKEIQRNIEVLEDTLEQFNIEANVVEVAHGPTITRYEVQLGPGIRVNRITALADNIAMGLAASHVRVEAPIPGKSAIGVEVPNSQRVMVTLREMVDTLEFHDQNSKLTVALGKDVSGTHKYTDLTRMPHLLVGGATNSGKSICLATIIMSLILRLSPRELRMVMIDPKRVEMTFFEGLPHLMCPVVKDVKEAPGVLRAVVREMDRRYERFSEAGVRNIDGWNAKFGPEEKLSYIVVIVDELADLMIQAAAEVETSICRLAQLARATGIHLVIATQRPSVDVITGTIKNNISSRIAFAVSSQIDSRTILDQAGAEKLIGKGDMLFLPIDATKAVRVQGCYVSEKEIEDVCDFWRAQEKPHYVLNPVQIVIEDKEAEMREQEDDPLWAQSVRWVVERGEGSTSMLQRKFSIGFQRASRLLDMMEERGVVGQRDGPRPRQVLMDHVRAEMMLGNDAYLSPMGEGSEDPDAEL